MKTFRILPWYFLLLILGLCVAIMTTTEGMLVDNEQVVNSSYTHATGIALLKKRASEYINNAAKTKKPMCAVFVSDSYKTRNMTKVRDDLNKNTKVDYLLFTSYDDTKTNVILQSISVAKLSAQNPVNPLVVLVANGAYKPTSNPNQTYIGDTTRFNEVKKIIDKYTTK